MTEALPALILFALSTLYTPGPNNIMLAASGANYGLRRSLPHILGVDFGFSFMVFAVGLGIGVAFDAFPALQSVMRWVGAAFLVYLGLRIAMAGRAEGGGARGRPFRFIEAAAFQWVNPKAWTMAIGAFAAFAPAGVAPAVTAAAFACLFLVLGFGSSLLWAGAGVAIGRWLRSDRHLRLFNVTLGALTIASVGLLFV